MSLLRLRQSAEGESRYRVVAEFENGGVRRSAESRFELQLTVQDQEDIRWYLEDFLQYPMDPAPAIAARIERRMAEIGADLFAKVLGNTPVWQEVRHDLSGTRVEIETTVKDATALPWELLRDPESDVPLALRARAFVRSTHDSVQRPKLLQAAGGPIRVLLVICRPRDVMMCRSDPSPAACWKACAIATRCGSPCCVRPHSSGWRTCYAKRKPRASRTTWCISTGTAPGANTARARAATATWNSKTGRSKRTSSLWTVRGWAACWLRRASPRWC